MQVNHSQEHQAPFDGRFRILDSYRFIAASLICVYHFNKANILGLATLSPLFENMRLMVDFFFILSGFVIARTYMQKIHNSADYRQFIWRRFARLYPLHLLTLMVGIIGGAMIGTQHLQAGTNPDVFSTKAIIANLTLTHSLGVTSYGSFNIPSWSISAEMFVYLLFPLFALMATRLSPLLNIALIGLYVLSMVLIRDALGLRDWTLTWHDMGALRAVPTFFAGVLTAQLLATRLRHFSPSIGWAHGAFLLSLLMMHLNVRDEWTLLSFVAVVLLAAAAEKNGARSTMQRPAFVHLGDASYSLYMWHMPIKAGVFAVFGKLFGTALLPMWGAAILSFALSLTTALLCYRLFEMPMRNWITGLWGKGAGRLERRSVPRMT
ncbi:MAG: acyltransferase family protein [Beijerinckiaceae bacterium]